MKNYKYIFAGFFAIMLFSTSNVFAVRRTFPTSVSLNGGGNHCQFGTVNITIPTMPTTTCGTGGSNDVVYTTSIFSNTTNSNTGGTLVATLTNNGGGFANNASYVAPSSTCGTQYYYAEVTWATDNCATGATLRSSAITVTIDCTCLAPSTNQSITTCGTTWYDPGGASANYANNQNYVVTFCPATAGDVIRVNFSSFDIENTGTTCNDFLELWQANSNAGAPANALCGNTAVTILSTSADGCVTFEFTSNTTTTRAGWAAQISCVTPCTNPTAALVNSSTVNICPSTSLAPGSLTVAFDASNSTSSAGTSISGYDWEWGDGTTTTTATPTTTHTYPNTSEIYVVKLKVRDNNTDVISNGCRSTNSITRIVRVLPAPSFTGTSASPINLACNANANLAGVLRSQTQTEITPTAVASQTNLPDGDGTSYNSTIDYSGFFATGATMAAGCYPTLCFNLEHSFSRDLTIDLIAPNGTSVRVFDRHILTAGGGANTQISVFGSCVNSSDVNPVVPGCGANYCVVNSGGSSWTAASSVTTGPPTTNGTCSYTGVCENQLYYIPQSYNSTNSFAGFNGVPLNGVWTLRITDNQGLDNGVLFNWSLTFPLSCYKPLETITPTISGLTWTHSGSGPAVPAQTTTSSSVVDPGPDGCQNVGTCVGNQLTNNVTVGPFTTSGTFDYVLTGTDQFGCQYRRTVQVLVTCACPTAAISATSTTLCSGGSTTINFNGSPNATVIYKINGGADQTIVLNSSGSASVNTGALSANTTYSIISADNGTCLQALTGTVNITVNPVPVLTPSPASQAICSGATTAINLSSSVGSTNFSWTATPSSGSITGATGNSGTSIAQTLSNSTTTSGTVTYSVTPATASCTGTPVDVIVTVNPIPNVTPAITDNDICSGQSADVNFSSNVAGTTFSWTTSVSGTVTGASNGSGNSLSQVLSNTGSASGTVTYTVTPTANSCPGTPANVVVTVNPIPTANVPGSNTYCPTDAVPVGTLSSTPTGGTFAWTNSNTAIGLGANGTGDVPAFTAANTGTTAISGTIAVTPTLNGCAGNTVNYIITINPTPAAVVPSSASYCPGNTVPTGALTSTPSGATFNWTNTNTTIGLGGSGSGNVPSFTAANAGSTTITGTIAVTPSLNGCTGTATNYTISVRPNPVAVVPANATYCPGNAVPVGTLSSTPAGGTFNWTNSNTAIGLGGSGSGDVPTFTAANTGSTVISGTVSVSSTLNGCTGSATTYTITVSPTPVAVIPSSNSYCPGNAVPAGALSSTPAGATMNWTNNNTTIGLGGSGTGNVPTFTAANTGSTTISGTISVTPVLSGCTGTAATYTISVRPTPVAVVPSSSTVCPGNSVSVVNLTSTPAGATFAWTNTNTAIGLGGSGSGNVPSFTAANTGTTAISGTISVTPTLNTCVGSAATYTVTVNPTPVAVLPSSNTFCAGATIAASTLTSTPAGATLNWTNNNTLIGLGGSGSGTVPSFTATNTGSSGISGTISVTPVLNGCTGSAASYTITVNPTPAAVVPSSSTLCSGTSVAAATLTSTPSGATFAWTNSNTAIGLGANGTGNVPSFTATNTGSSGITGTISVVPTLSGCAGSATTYSITVNPTPVAVLPSSSSFCSGANVPVGTLSSTPSGATLNWTNTNTAIGLGGSGTGNVPSFTATNTGASAINGTISVTPSLGGCTGTAANYTITINPADNASFSYASGTICKTGGLQNATISGLTGGTFSSTSGLTINATTGQIDPATSTTGGPYTVTYTTNGACPNTSTFPVTITTNPQSTFNYSGPYCAGSGTATVTLPSGSSGGVFSSTSGLVINSSTGAVDLAASTPNTYTVTNAIAAGGGCAASSSTTSITINAQPTVSGGSNQTLCLGSSVTLSGSGATSYTWNNGVSNGVSFTPSATGTTTYTVTGTDANTCTNTATVSVTVNANPTVSGGANQTLCLGSSVTLSGSGATSYTWNNGVTNGVTFTPTAAGTTTYTVTGTDANNCSNTATVNVTVNANPAVSGGAAQAICIGNQVTLNGSGAVAYTWDNSVINGVAFTPSATGTTTYTVTGTDANNCSNTATVNVTVNALPTVSGGADQTACIGTAITLTGSGATSYTWTNSVTNGVPFTPSATGTTSYTVTGTDANNCTNTATLNVTINSLPTVTGGANQDICLGTSVTLSGSGATTYTWDNSVVDGVTFTPSSAGTTTYTVTGTDANNCSNTAAVVVTVNNLPTVLAGTDQTLCMGGDVVLNGSGATSYTWDNSVVNGVTFTPSTTGTVTYTVTGTDDNGCTNTASVNVTVNALPVVVANVTLNTICLGSDVTFTGSGASTYVWDNSVVDGVPFTPSASGTLTYNVTGTDANGCTATSSVDVTVNNIDDPAFTYPSGTVCVTGSDPTPNISGLSGGIFTSTSGINLDPSTGTITLAGTTLGSYTITYTTNGTCPSSATFDVVITDSPVATFSYSGPYCINSTAAVTVTFASGASGGVFSSSSGLSINSTTGEVNLAASTPGTYTVTNFIAASNGCAQTQATANLVINALPTVSAGSDLTECLGDTITLSGSGATTYTWDNSVVDGVSFTPSTTGATTYTVTGTDDNGCVNTASVVVTINALPNVTATNQTACINSQVTLSGAGASTYTWTGPTTVTNGVPFTVTSTGTQTYTVTGTDANGCTNTATADVTVNPMDDATFSYPSTTVCITGTDPTPTITGLAGGTFSSTSGISLNPSTGTITLASSTPSTTPYTIIYLTNGACPDSSTFDLQITDSVKTTFNYASAYCEGGGTADITLGTGATAGTFSSTTGLVIDPNTGAINLNTSTPGTYTVLNDFPASGGCKASLSSATVTINALPTVNAGTDATICRNVTRLNGSVQNFTGISWTLTDGTFVSDSLTPTVTLPQTSTDYVFTASNSGCLRVDTVRVTNKSVVAGFTATPLSGTSPLTVQFVNQSTNATTYSWDFGDGSSSVTTENAENTYGNEATYVVVLTASNEFCTDTATTEIIVSGTSYIVMPNVFTPNNDGKNDMLMADYKSIVEFKAVVYDRWGIKMFEWNDVKGGWDGNGVSEGVYYYLVTAKGADNKEYDFKGWVQLLK